jgi:hypothetical protein
MRKSKNKNAVIEMTEKQTSKYDFFPLNFAKYFAHLRNKRLNVGAFHK